MSDMQTSAHDAHTLHYRVLSRSCQHNAHTRCSRVARVFRHLPFQTRPPTLCEAEFTGLRRAVQEERSHDPLTE